MARKLSRRALAQYVAAYLIEGKPQADIARQLAAYLISTRRTRELASVIRDIQYFLAKSGTVSGTVTSAHALSDATLKALEAFAGDELNATKVHLEPTLDESLIGGVRLEVPGYVLDTSIARKLTTLKTRYKKA